MLLEIANQKVGHTRAKNHMWSPSPLGKVPPVLPHIQLWPQRLTKSVAFGSWWQFFTPENPSELIELYSTRQ